MKYFDREFGSCAYHNNNKSNNRAKAKTKIFCCYFVYPWTVSTVLSHSYRHISLESSRNSPLLGKFDKTQELIAHIQEIMYCMFPSTDNGLTFRLNLNGTVSVSQSVKWGSALLASATANMLRLLRFVRISSASSAVHSAVHYAFFPTNSARFKCALWRNKNARKSKNREFPRFKKKNIGFYLFVFYLYIYVYILFYWPNILNSNLLMKDQLNISD